MKKTLALLISGIILFSLCSCNNGADNTPKGKKLSLFLESWEENDKKLSVDFFYPEDKGITVEIDEESPSSAEIVYTEKNIKILPSLVEDTAFDDNKDYDRDNQENYKEFKIGKYDCYGYEAYGGYWIYVHLEQCSDSSDRYLIIYTETIDYSKDFTEGIAHYEDKEVKKIIESFVYN